jgi:Leucine-rich repeat (LRR) protein
VAPHALVSMGGACSRAARRRRHTTIGQGAVGSSAGLRVQQLDPTRVWPLTELCVRTILANLEQYPPERLATLPHELANHMFRTMAAAGALDTAALESFRSCRHLSEVSIADQAIDEEWMRQLAAVTRASAGSMQRVELRRCPRVPDLSLELLAPYRCLRVLVLDYCVQITDDGLGFLRGMFDLQSLSLEACANVTSRGIRALRDLRNITVLNLNQLRNLTDDAMVTVRGMVRLHTLLLGWCNKISDNGVANLAGHPQLRTLFLSHTDISDAAATSTLAKMPQLRHLSLGGCNVTDVTLEALTGSPESCARLQSVDVHGTSVTAAGMAGLLTLRKLQSLNLAFCSADDDLVGRLCEQPTEGSGAADADADADADAEVEGLPLLGIGAYGSVSRAAPRPPSLAALTSLNLDSSPITDAALPAIGKLSALTCLNLSDTRVSSASLTHIAELNVLTELNLSHSAVNDNDPAGLAALSRCQSLTMLNLDAAEVGDGVAAACAQLGSLTRLDLFGSHVTDQGAAALSRRREASALRQLELSGCRITDDGCRELANLRGLVSLGLAQNFAVSDVGLSYITRGLPRLQSLSLGYTNVSAQGLETIVTLHRRPAPEGGGRQSRQRAAQSAAMLPPVRVGLVSLTHLSVYNCAVTAGTAAHLRKLLPGLRIRM